MPHQRNRLVALAALACLVAALSVVPGGSEADAGTVAYSYAGMYFDPAGVAPLYPAGGDSDGSGNRYVADSGGDRIVKLNASGVQSVVSTSGWNKPRDLVLDTDGTSLWVADTTDNQIVEISTLGAPLHTFGGTAAFTKAPFGIAVDATGVFVADTYNSRVFKMDRNGTKLWTQGTCLGALSRPRDLTIGSDGNVYVADTDHNRVAVLDPTDGHCLRAFGSAGKGNGQFSSPRSIVSDGSGGLWVAEAHGPRLQHVTNAGAGLGYIGTYGSGPGKFRAPACVFMDGAKVDVCDTYEYVIQRFSVSGSGAPSYFDSLGGIRPVVGGFNQPFGVAFAPDGDLYVSDMFNHRMERRTTGGTWTSWGGFGTRPGNFQFPRGVIVSPDGTKVVVTNSENNRIDLYTRAGALINSVRPGGTTFGWPHQTALANDGTYWVADTNRNRVLHLSTSGAVLDTITHNGAIKTPRGVALDAAGNIYVSNSGANTIEKYSPSLTYLGALATKGPGPGQVALPWNLTIAVVGGAENLFVADGNNGRVDVFNTSTGTFVTSFGTQGSGLGQLLSPRSVSVDPITGTVAVADFGNNRISLWS